MGSVVAWVSFAVCRYDEDGELCLWNICNSFLDNQRISGFLSSTSWDEVKVQAQCSNLLGRSQKGPLPAHRARIGFDSLVPVDSQVLPRFHFASPRI
jgi:hypothetical protein